MKTLKAPQRTADLVYTSTDDNLLYIHIKINDTTYKKIPIATIDFKPYSSENINEVLRDLKEILNGKSYREWESVLKNIKDNNVS